MITNLVHIGFMRSSALRFGLFRILLAFKVMAKRLRPNYFVGFKLTQPEFVSIITDVQISIQSTHPHLGKCITSANKLHITSILMELKNSDDVSSAISCFKDCESRILDTIRSVENFRVNFGRISSFGTKVLYLEPTSDQNLQIMNDIHRLVEEAFMNYEPKLSIERTDELKGWIPHATIMKTSADKRNGRYLSIPREDFLIYEDRIQRPVPVLSLDLLSMTEKDSFGYYKSYATIPLDGQIVSADSL